MQEENADDILTTAQAAARLGVAPNSVMAWADSGLLRAWRTPGGHRRISAASVQAMLDQRNQRVAATHAQTASLMLVEDNPDTAAVLSNHLNRILPAARVRIVRDGFQALLEAGRVVPDLLVTDINLPGMNGIAMIRSLQSQPIAARMRFVLVTNYARHELGPFGEPPDGVPLLSKPVSIDALREAIMPLLSGPLVSP